MYAVEVMCLCDRRMLVYNKLAGWEPPCVAMTCRPYDGDIDIKALTKPEENLQPENTVLLVDFLEEDIDRYASAASVWEL